jgi:outer membrane receptor protein involved in Fe transport
MPLRAKDLSMLKLPFAVAAIGLMVPTMVGATDAEESEVGLPNIVVTAQRRSENLQSVPISITALDGANLEQLGLTRLYDLARQVPGVNVVSSGPGQNILIIRGISSTAGTTGTVGFYLDDTPIQASSNAAQLSARGVFDPALFDLARVEVLRGPQGTLYGSSSMGGTIKYVTNQPDAKQFEATSRSTVSYTEGGGPNVEQIGTVNLPLTESAAARITAFYRHNDGFIDRFGINPTSYLNIDPSIVDRRVNSENSDGVRAAIKIDLPSGLSVTPSAIYQETRLGGPFNIDEPQGNFGSLIQARDTAEPSTQKTWLGNLTIREVLPSFELLSSTSYYSRDIRLSEDASNVLYFFFSPVPQNSVYPAFIAGDYRNKEWTQEFRATSAFQGPWQVTGGLFYHNVSAPLESAIPDPPGYDAKFGSPFGGETFFHGIRKAGLREYAAYSEGSYAFDDGWRITVGARAFKVNQTFFQEGDGVFNGGTTFTNSDSADHGINPKFTVSKQLGADDLFYATASKGFRAGGPNNPAPASVCGAEVGKLGLSESALTKYGSDNLWNYELGAKTRWLDRKLTVNSSIYYIDWRDVQQQIVLQCGFNITANFGSATSKGAEIETEYVPVRGLTLSASGGYTDATLGNDIPGSPAKKGDQLTDVPRWSMAISGQYEHPLSDIVAGFFRADFTDRAGANALYDRTSPFYHYDGFSQTNIRLGVEQGEQWKAAVFLDNAFNKIGETALPVAVAADLPTTRRIAINTPRTVGLTFDYKF